MTELVDAAADRRVRRPRRCYHRSRCLRHRAISQGCTDELLRGHISTSPPRTPLCRRHNEQRFNSGLTEIAWT